MVSASKDLSTVFILGVAHDKLRFWSVGVKDGSLSASKQLGPPVALNPDSAKPIKGGFAYVGPSSSKLTILRGSGAEISLVDLSKLGGSITRVKASPLSDLLIVDSSSGKCGVVAPSKGEIMSTVFEGEGASDSYMTLGFVKGGKADSGSLRNTLVRAVHSKADSTGNTKVTVTLHDFSGSSGKSVAQSLAKDLRIGRDIGSPVEVFTQLLKKTGKYRAMVLTSSDVLLGVQQGSVLWTREEALAKITAAEFMPLPLASAPVAGGGQFPGFFERLMIQASNLASSVQELVESVTASITDEETAISKLESDHFGFQKLIVALSSVGRVYGLSTTKGSILWVRQLPGPSCSWRELKLVSTSLVVACGICGDDGSGKLLALRPRSGEIVAVREVTYDKVIKLPLYSTGDWLLETRGSVVHSDMSSATPTRQRSLVVASFASKTAMVIPPTKKALSDFDTYRSRMFLYSVDMSNEVIQGYCVRQQTQKGVFGLQDTWTVSFPTDFERISDIAAPDTDSAIHSPVMAMGDGKAPKRKYLNGNILAVATVKAEGGIPRGAVLGNSQDTASAVVLYIIDTVTGKIIHRVSQKNGKGPVHLAVTENLIVMHYFESKANSFEITCLELFEDAKKVAKMDAAMMATMDVEKPEDLGFSSHVAPPPVVLQKTFLFSHSVRFLGVAGTRLGITSKLILAGLSSNHLAGIGRHVLDTRRPMGEAPLTKEQSAEGLLPYHPVIKLDSKAFPSYNLTLCRLRDLSSSYTFLESTSLVFTFGVDIFFTRVTASGAFDLLSSDFNRLFLAGTVTLVVVILGVTNRMSRQKRLAVLWS